MKFTADELRNNILSTGNTENYYKIKGKRYYISQNGSDNNDGLSPESAFATPDAIANITLTSGDAVLFERGSYFRITNSICMESGVTYGSYGEGQKPVISTSPADYARQTWSQTDKENVWQASFNYMPAVGIVFNHGKEFGTLRHSDTVITVPKRRWYYEGDVTLKENGEFRHDYNGGIIYLYCDKGNPSAIYDSIEILSDLTAITAKYKELENVVVDNLCVKYCGGFAISIGYSKENITITNCELGYLGGRFFSNCRVRYGNAIEFWEGYHNLTVKNNWIYHTYDSAITWQGRAGIPVDNVVFNQNLLEYNHCDIEFFEYESLKNFEMNNNIMRFTSSGWGDRSVDCAPRDDIEGCVRGVFSRLKGTLENVSFCGNVMYSPAKRIINCPLNEGQLEKIKCENNTLYFSPSHRLSDEVILVELDKPISSSNHEELEKAVSLFDDSMDIKYID